LGALGSKSNNSHASAVNSTGLVVGYSTVSAVESRATAWVNRVIKNLGSLGGPEGAALAVNDAGQIVGYDSVPDTAQFMDFAQHPFLWQSGVMTDLGTLNNADPKQSGIASGISASGTVVGHVLLNQDGGLSAHRGVMWKDGGIIDLNAELRSYLPTNELVVDATAISADGRFVVETLVPPYDQKWYEVLPLADSTTVLTASPNPDFVGETVTLRATISSTTSVRPALGTVTFKDGAHVIGSATVSLFGSVATLSTASLALGTHSLTAVYSGNDLYAPSTSKAVSEAVRLKAIPIPQR
jgi:probable HAF family extracellular repeat protein